MTERERLKATPLTAVYKLLFTVSALSEKDIMGIKYRG